MCGIRIIFATVVFLAIVGPIMVSTEVRSFYILDGVHRSRAIILLIVISWMIQLIKTLAKYKKPFCI